MKCQMQFSGENTKSITNLLSAELALRMVKVNRIENTITFVFSQYEGTTL